MTRKPYTSSAIRWAAVTLLLGLSLTALACLYIDRRNAETLQQAANRQAQSALDAIVERLQRYEYGLRGARGAFIAAGPAGLNREIFHRYAQSREPDREFPGARGFGIIRRVADAELPRFLSAMKTGGSPGFKLRQFSRYHGEHAIIQFIEPASGNGAAIGLDINSDPTRRAAAQEAVDSGGARLSEPITLLQATPLRGQGFLLLLPIYRGIAVPADVNERRRQITGWSYAPLAMPEVLAGLNLPHQEGWIELSDTSNPARPARFFRSRSGAASADAAIATQSAPLFGRVWRLDFHADPAFTEALRLPNPRLIALAGLLASLAGAALAYAWRSNALSRRKLQDTREDLAAIVESSIDAIIGKTLSGVVISWNKGAQQMFGYAADEAVGQSLLRLIVPEDRQAEEQDILTRIARGERIAHFQTTRRRKDGSQLEVAVSVAPIYGDDGKVTGAAKTVRDITRQKEMEAELHALNTSLEAQVAERTRQLETARRDLRTVLDGVPSMIGYWDKELINRVANHAYHAWFHREPDTLPGTRLPELLGEESFAISRPHVEAALAGRPQSFERTLEGLDGELRHTLVHYLPDKENGEVRGFYSVVHDVTELVDGRTRLAAALRENEALLGIINEQLQYSEIDAAGRFLEVNERFCEVNGYARGELIGRNHLLLTGDLQDQAFWRALKKTLRRGEAWHGEICNRARDGSLRWSDTVIAPLHDGAGAIERVIALRIDTTRRRLIDAEINRLSLLLSNVLSAASEVSIIATDRDGLITVFNAGAEQMLGYTQQEMVGIHTPARFHLESEVADRSRELSEQFGEDISGFRAFVHMPEIFGAETREWTYARKDGSHVSVSLVVTAMRETGGGISGYVGIATDITERQRSETRLLQAKQLAEQASQAKSRFLANMSHEIRTPLNAVLGLLQLMRHTALDGRQLDYVTKTQTAAKSLLGLLNDILDFSKIEAGKLQLDRHPFQLDNLLRDLGIILSGNRGDKEVETVFEIDPALPSAIVGDRLRLQQILINLAGNAMKFTERGQVIVSVALIREQERQAALRFSVSDTGIGIEAEQLGRIFDGFTQAEASTARRFGGTGLGLAISQRLVRMMGGQLTAQSAPGRGSRFSFEIELETADAAPLVAADAALPQNLRALIVDDNPLTGEVLGRTLETAGWRADYAASGAEAVRMAEAGQRYDVALMDWKMPGMDGVEAASRIRAAVSTPPVVIMLTAFGREVLSEIADSGDPPFADFLTKPVTPQQLLDAVRRNLLGERAPPPSPAIRQRLGGMRLLLVEDNALNRQVASELLSAEGARVELAEGGLAGVELATAADADYDVVIMDMQMPDIDGLEATRRIRAGGCGTPILAMTANATLADRADCLAAGMNDHIGKPIDIDQLASRLLALSGRAPDSAPAAPETCPPCDIEPEEQVLQRFGQHAGAMRAALRQFRTEAHRLAAVLRQQLESGDTAQGAATLHALKGIAATVGAAALARQAGELEQRARQSDGSELDAEAWRGAAETLQRLVAESVAKLDGRLPAAPSAAPAETPPLTPQEWKERLLEILPLLESGNLAAIDLAMALPPLAGGHIRQQVESLAEQVGRLQFAPAAQIVKTLIGSEP
ncbi:CHASE domain-containing hybrid sensor histidine kinase/response regulator [Chromobacterium vaccinii]|uniref:CHASE domain-containing hybrid sensor histidine kinase/response regulator n=1 Tax=Chromobacterium vaccinii TaxID=1108595 RepID=UPI000E153333|nr:PAS domain S-box protein [Chromobacterium vaccinii]SUX54028.1 Signal transduction histidine-protein kinase BarA [Chromobacterium vaccinii]